MLEKEKHACGSPGEHGTLENGGSALRLCAAPDQSAAAGDNTAATPSAACPCQRKKCPRFGNCAACMEHHRNGRYPPCCQKGRVKEAGGAAKRKK